MSAQIINFALKKVSTQNRYSMGFANSSDFVLAITSDSELINRLGFSSRVKKRGIKSRTENDYLYCYKFYLDSEIRTCESVGDYKSFNSLQKAHQILNYLMNQKNSFQKDKNRAFFSEKQSFALAKLKSAIRSIIVEYNIQKFNSNAVLAVA